MQGAGIALAPACMFARELQLGMLARPLDIDVRGGAYWLTSLKSKPLTPAMQLFRDWIVAEAADAPPHE
jgi:LysR family transcriptional regulator of beta-lactamase